MDNLLKYIPTITASVNHPIAYKPVLSSLPPADWCQHNTVKNLCAFCSKLPFTTESAAPDCSGSIYYPSTLPASYCATCGRCSSCSVLSPFLHRPSVPDGSILSSPRNQVAQMKLSDLPELNKKVCESHR